MAYGASAANYGDSSRNARVNLTNSIIRGAESPLHAGTHPGATGTAIVAASYSDYDPSGITTEENGSISESNVFNVGDAGFGNAAAGDYTLSEAAKVTFRVQRAVPGSRTRYRTIGTLTRNGASGANSTRLSARLRKRVSRPGHYRIRIAAADSAGNRSAPRTARFRVAAR